LYSSFYDQIELKCVAVFVVCIPGSGHPSSVQATYRASGMSEEEIRQHSEARVYEVEHVLAFKAFLSEHINKEMGGLQVGTPE
jgi:hypothetical protein